MTGSDEEGERAWYACYTRARHEKRVNARLEERGFDTFLPLVPRVRQWHDREKVVQWPLFPSYVFARFDLGSLADVLRTPGVSTVVRFNGRPVPVPQEEIDSVRRFVDALQDRESEGWEPEPLVERRGRQRALIQIGVEAIGQGVKVEVDANSLETEDGDEAQSR